MTRSPFENIVFQFVYLHHLISWRDFSMLMMGFSVAGFSAKIVFLRPSRSFGLMMLGSRLRNMAPRSIFFRLLFPLLMMVLYRLRLLWRINPAWVSFGSYETKHPLYQISIKDDLKKAKELFMIIGWKLLNFVETLYKNWVGYIWIMHYDYFFLIWQWLEFILV